MTESVTNLQHLAAAQLPTGEIVRLWVETDLDANRFYAVGLLGVTDRRVIGVQTNRGNCDEPNFETIPLSEIQAITAKEQGALGSIEFQTTQGTTLVWRYTVGRSIPIHNLVVLIEKLKLADAEPDDIDEPDESEIEPDAPLPPITKSFARLTQFAKPHFKMVLLGFALTLAGTAASLIPSCVTEPLVDEVLIPYQEGRSKDLSLLPWLLGGLFGAAVIAWLLGWAKTWVLAWVSERVAADLRIKTYAHLQRMSLEFFGGKRTGDLISRIDTDTDRICYFISVHLIDFASDVIMLLMIAGIMIQKDFWLATVTLLPLPIISWLIHVVREKLRTGFIIGSRAWAEMTNVLADTIPGIRVVKAFAQEQREIDRFQARNDNVVRANNHVNKLWSQFSPMVVLLTDLGIMLIWSFGVWEVIHQGLTVGRLSLFIALITKFYGRIEAVSRLVEPTQRAANSAHRIFEILDRIPSIANPPNPVRPGRVRGEVEFRDVQFRYGTRPILKGVTLHIQPGEMIGLVGPSGAGKTTLINLVCRFHDVSEGAILIDGTDVRQFALEDYRRNIGIVLQEPFLFYGTIADNIAYGRPDATREEIISAAKAARAHEFILRQPDGYDSFVGERGMSLSGGERQRISIARALLIDPRILILDEATSAVDTETEREIQLALENLTRGRTTIAIAHRLSTLRRADRLVVLEQGRITDIGPHDDLLARGGTYARLHQAQLDMAHGDVGEAAPHPVI